MKKTTSIVDHKFLSVIIENVPGMIFIKDAKDLRFVHFNKAGEELLGYSREDLIGKNDYDFFSKEQADFFTAKDRATLAEGKIVDIPEEPIQTKFKGERILHTKKVTIYDEQGNPEYLLGISDDITERKQAEDVSRRLVQEKAAREEAEKTLNLRDEFISIAAHELNTPLTALTLQLHLVDRLLETHGGKLLQDHFKSCHMQVDRFAKLIENLLDATRASAGRLSIDKDEADLCEVIRRVLKWYEPELKKTHCTLTLDCDQTLTGFWDPLRIEQVVTNLLSNAIKFGSGKEIEISMRKEENMARLSVRDHGVGLSEEGKARIFNRFERAASMKTYPGLGLGLYISNQIVLAHGGRMKVESKLGEGSCFTVELPLRS